MARRAVFPGSFDPPTVAHTEIARRVLAFGHADLVEFVISVDPLGKAADEQSPATDRIAMLEGLGMERTSARVTTRRLLADIAANADALVIGADKHRQLHEVRFYDDEAHRDAAIASLPQLIVFPRFGESLPEPSERVTVLVLPDDIQRVSASAVRAGRVDWGA